MADEFRHANDSDMTSKIGQRDRTRGDFHVGGGLRVEGVVRGNILAAEDDASLIVCPRARVEGDVRIGRARIEGHVTGTVTVIGHLDILDGGVVEGDVHYGSIAIASGARVTGVLSSRRSELED